MKSQIKIQNLTYFSQNLQIPTQEQWVLLDVSDEDIDQTIILAAWSRLDIYSSRTTGRFHLHIIHSGEGSCSCIRCGFHAGEGGKIDVNIRSSFEASHTKSEVHILSLADSGSEVVLNSSIDAHKWIQSVIGRLQERHIFLGDSGKIRGIPALLVHTDDIEASHALAIDRISDEQLFYLRSRGFPRDDARSLLIEGAISDIFEGLAIVDEEQYIECKKRLL